MVAPCFGAQASKLTVSQVEIGFDILKARDVPVEVGGTDEAEFVAPVSAAVAPSSLTAAATSVGTSTASASSDHATAAAKTGAAVLSPRDGDSKETDTVDDGRKRYRLMVKRRLLKRHGEELSTDAATRKRQLEELYRDVEADLLGAAAKLRKEREETKSCSVAKA